MPVLGIRTPRGVGEVAPHIINSIKTQMKNLASDLSRITGEKLRDEPLFQVLELSKQSSDLWKEVLETAAHRPSPITFTDVCFHMGPAVNLRGTRLAVSYYQELLGEVKARMQKGMGAILRERFRVYWEGMPIWGKLKFLAETMARMEGTSHSPPVILKPSPYRLWVNSEILRRFRALEKRSI